MLTKSIAVALAVSAAAVAGPAFAQAIPEAKIAIVDSERVFGECAACKVASTQLQTQRTQIQTFAQSLGLPLETEAKALQAAVNTAKGNPDAALQTRIATFQGKQQQAQQQVAAREQTFQRNVGYVREQIGVKIGPIIGQIAQARGVTIAMDKGSTFYSAPTIDITDAVLAQLNTALPSVSVVAPPQAAAPGAPAGTTAPTGR